MKKLILLIVLLVGTAVWPSRPSPSPFTAQSTSGLFRAPTGAMHRAVNGVDLGPVDGSFAPEVNIPLVPTLHAHELPQPLQKTLEQPLSDAELFSTTGASTTAYQFSNWTTLVEPRPLTFMHGGESLFIVGADYRSFSFDNGASWHTLDEMRAALGEPQEVVTLTTPVVPPTNTACRLERLTIEPIAGRIYVQLLGTNGEASSKVYDATTTPTGAALISALNTSNNTTTSLVKRVYTRLIADGVCVGTVGGTPQ